MVAFQIGLPNQMAKRSIFNPRQRAARKWPNSCTKMSRLKSNTTSNRIKTNFKTVIFQLKQTTPKWDRSNIAGCVPEAIPEEGPKLDSSKAEARIPMEPFANLRPLSRCLAPRPCIRLKDLIEIRMHHYFVPLHRALDHFGNLREIDATVHKRFHSDFICSVQNRWQRAAFVAGSPCQRKCREPFRVGFLESE